MDNINNYIGLLPSLRASKEQQEEKVKSLSQEMKDRFQQYTTPIGETFMADAGKDLLTKIGTGLAGKFKKIGHSAEKAQRYVKAYQDKGVKGVVNEGIKDLRGKAPVREQSIKDLDPDEYHTLRSTIQQAQMERFHSYDDNIQNSIRRRFQNERLTPDDEPNPKIMNRNNAQTANDIMDDYDQRQQAFEGQNPLQRNLPFTGDDDDSLLSSTQKTIQGVKQTAKEGADELENVGKKGTKLAEKVASKVAETEAETGGPEDIFGDVVTGLVGLGTLIAGIKAGKHIHQQTPNDIISNATYQAGA